MGKGDRRDLIQNIAIVFLTLLAVFLLVRTQFYGLGSGAARDYLSRYLTAEAEPSGAPPSLTGFSTPVRVAVTGVYGGRYGSVSMTTGDRTFEPLAGLLREVLGSVRSFAPCTQADFIASLGSTSVYYDFLSSLPLPVLAGLLGAKVEEDVSARRITLSAGGDGSVSLYLWDGQEGFLRGSSAVTAEELGQTVGGYELNGAAFAFDEPAPHASEIAPCSLLLTELPELSKLSASISLPDTDQLLEDLGFYPRTNSRYMESDQVEVVTEGDRSLRIDLQGLVRYRSGGEDVLSIAAAEVGSPTLEESVTGVWTLLDTLLTPCAGEARLYLQSVRQTEAATTLAFGYQVGGVPVRFADGGAAAEAVLTGSTISSLSLRFRRYSASGEVSLLLPLPQVLAVAAREQGAELSIGYGDSGGDTVPAQWLSDRT